MTETVQVMGGVVSSIVLVGVLTCCALLHFMCDLKTAQMNMQCSLIQELMLNVFEEEHNTTEESKTIC